MNKDDVTKLVKSNLEKYKLGGLMDINLSGEVAAEEVFDITNNPDRQHEREIFYGRGRSISVGDVVEVDDVNYLCGSVGWKVVR
jgi:hypothetical protein